MEIAWDQYKPILRRAYFGDSESSLAPRDSDAAADFWSFFAKYLIVVRRKQLSATNARSSCDGQAEFRNEIGLPQGPFQKYLRPFTSLKIEKTAKYILREVR